MTIRSKVIGSFLIVSLVSLALSYLNYHRSLNANRQLTLINELYLPLSRIIVQMQGHVHGLAEDSKKLQIIALQSPEKGTFSRMVRDLYPYLIFRKISAAETLLTQSKLSETGFDRRPVEKELVAIKALFEKATQANTLSELEPIYQDARIRLQGISRLVDEESQSVTGSAQRYAARNLQWSAALATILLVLAIMSLWVSSKALRPLPYLIESIKHNATGDFMKSLKVSPNENNEFGVLAREYNKMLAALSDRDKQIQTQQKELVQAERLATVGKLSAEIVHEIRNPLNSISLNIDWMTSELKTPDPEIQKTLTSLSKEVERLNEITERYLMQARVSERSDATVDLNDVVGELAQFLSEEHKKRKIELNLKLLQKPVRVTADRSRLRQAFLNILKNSREAMPHGGAITIESRVLQNTCEIVFGDSGCGMSSTTLDNAFRPFFSTKSNGNGLGLMLTRTVIEEAHGTLTVKSKMGEGTHCHVQFPASFS